MDENVNKRPAFQFYPADWRKDPNLQMCSMSTQGIWINLLCVMWEANPEGIISGPTNALTRLLGCTDEELEEFFCEAKQYNFATVTNCNEIVTIECRRMYRVFLEREGIKMRVSAYRQRQQEKSNADVTLHSSTSTSSSKEREVLKRKKFSPPTLQEITEYVKKNNYVVDTKKFFDYYTASGWIDSNGHKVRSWKQKVITWSGRGGLDGKKTKLLPIIGKICGLPGCCMPAVYKDTKGNYDHYYCREHMPKEVKQYYE